MDRTPTYYALSTDAPGRRALKRLELRFRARRQPYPPHRTTWLDTFDWRLFNEGAALAFEEGPGGCSLLWRDDEGLIRHSHAAQRPPLFAEDLPAGPLRERAAALMDVRRLFPVGRTETTGETLRLLDANNRTIVRIDLEKIDALHPSRTVSHPLKPRLRLTPSAGSGAVIQDVRDILETELSLKRDTSTIMLDALAAIGARAGKPAKARAVIGPRLKAADAARRIQRALLRTLRLNERGAREALDPEFLHDYRVAVRRIRTCLAQLRTVLPARAVARFRRDFRWLGQLTNPARDMDVFRMAMADHARLLPPQHRRDIDPLIAFVVSRQQAEQRKLTDGMRSERYKRLLRDWSAFLRTKPAAGPQAPHGHRPVLEVASDRIAKRFARVIRRGEALKAKSPDLKFHRLRVECKKLRYLLEFFQDLYDTDEVESLVAPLRKLQDTLGEFNDLRVQRGALRPFAKDLARTDGAPVECLIAVGRLEERLQQRQDKLRKQFRKHFAEFVEAKSRERLEKMLSEPAKKAPPARGGEALTA